MMDEITRKENLLQALTTVEVAPAVLDSEITTVTQTSLPLTRLTALGTGFEPVVSAIQHVLSNGKAVSGYYKVTIPKGTHLAKFKEEASFLGAAFQDGSEALVGQARLNPLVCNPTMLFVAATLASIDKKLDTIMETQQEMLDFIVQKEKSELKGDLDFLTDVFNNYKFNWNNDKFKASNHIKVLDIRQSSGRKIDFYREQIKKRLSKKLLFHGDRDVKQLLDQIQDDFKDYQLSLYLFGFAYFLEVVLQENFNEDYLESISTKIDLLDQQYQELYTNAFAELEARTKSSIQSRVLGGLSIVNKVAGETIAKIPVISNSQIDETLIETGQKISAFDEKRSERTMSILLDRESSFIRPFVEQIDNINFVYNKPMTLIFNDETLYLGTADVE
jgi:hypothetical protein